MIIHEIPAKPKEKKQLRVIAYARVSTDKDAAFHSLEAQMEYYQKYVSLHPDWVLVNVYSDNGISGTTSERPAFQQMLQDCRDGKADLVITKSITRFARNTVVLLQTIRELKKLGVDCYFEKEDMHSISPDGELLMTLLAMYAEEEARNVSENQKWRIRKLYEQGKPAGGHIYGYRLVDGVYEIVPEEAEVVKRIYDLYLSGLGRASIIKILNSERIPARFGGKWSETSISDILSNEKYGGDLILQKKYVSDFRSKKLTINRGEMRKVFVENDHQPIIDRETFEEAQREIARRHERYARKACRKECTDGENMFRGLMHCGYCGSTFIRKRKAVTAGIKYIWQCYEYRMHGLNACQSRYIPEDILIDKTKEVLDTDCLTATLLQELIFRIDVPDHNHLVFTLKNGDVTTAYWEHKSRSESWTPEMRQLAREKTHEYNRKKRKRKEDKI